MKYTEENLRYVLRKLSPTFYDALYKDARYLPEILELIELKMFRKILWGGVIIQTEDAIILQQAIENLENTGMFNFEEWYVDPWLTDKKFKCYKKMGNVVVITLDDLSNSAGDQQKMPTSDMEKAREK